MLQPYKFSESELFAYRQTKEALEAIIRQGKKNGLTYMFQTAIGEPPTLMLVKNKKPVDFGYKTARSLARAFSAGTDISVQALDLIASRSIHDVRALALGS